MSKDELMWRVQIIEMANNLLRLSTDAYISFKYMVLANAILCCSPGGINFIKELFAFADRNRPLLLEMNGDIL